MTEIISLESFSDGSFTVPPRGVVVSYYLGGAGVQANESGAPGDFDSFGNYCGNGFYVVPGDVVSWTIGETSHGQKGGRGGGGDGGFSRGAATHGINGRGGAGCSVLYKNGTIVTVAAGSGGGIQLDGNPFGQFSDDFYIGGGWADRPGVDGGWHAGSQFGVGHGGTPTAGGAGGFSDGFFDAGTPGGYLKGGIGGSGLVDGTLAGHGGGAGLYGGGGSSIMSAGGGGGCSTPDWQGWHQNGSTFGIGSSLAFEINGVLARFTQGFIQLNYELDDVPYPLRLLQRDDGMQRDPRLHAFNQKTGARAANPVGGSNGPSSRQVNQAARAYQRGSYW